MRFKFMTGKVTNSPEQRKSEDQPNLTPRAADGGRTLLPIRDRGIRTGVQKILVSVPEIDVRLVILGVFLLLPLDRGQSFLFLIPHPSRLSSLATS